MFSMPSWPGENLGKFGRILEQISENLRHNRGRSLWFSPGHKGFENMFYFLSDFRKVFGYG